MILSIFLLFIVAWGLLLGGYYIYHKQIEISDSEVISRYEACQDVTHISFSDEDETISFEWFVYLYSDLWENHPAYSSGQSSNEITQVRVDSGVRPIILPKDHPRYDELYNIIVSSKERKPENIVKTTIGKPVKPNDRRSPIIDIEIVPFERQKKLWDCLQQWW